MNPKVGLVEETKGGGKEGKKVNNDETHHVYAGTRHKNTVNTVEQHRIGGKG
jgi:hypothetical protein